MPPSSDDLLSALDPEQREVAETLRGPVRVLAGAGTGKTRAITHRIAHGVASGVYVPTEVLAVTFTTRAAGEMRARLRRLGAPTVQARTFHSAALRQLRYFWPHVHGTELPTLVESKIPIVVGAARQLRMRTDQAMLRDLASEIEWAKVSNVRPDDYVEVAAARGRSVAQLEADQVARVIGAYEDVKREQGRMDMEDVLLLTAGVLAEDERVAAQVRRQYKWFVVDEFQDVSPLQSALLDLWLGGRDELCVVGDPAQTIYSFAGANADYLRDFPRKHAGTTSIELVRNYRSTPQVVGAANTLLAGTGSTSVQLRAQRPAGAAVTYTGHPDEVAEATDVAGRVAALRSAGRPLSEIAVLFRINAQSEAYEEALTEAKIPYVIRGAARFFDRPEVREAVTRLRGAARSGAQAADGDTWVDLVRDTLAGMGWTTEAPTARGQTRDRWESWQALVSQAEAFAGEAASGGDGGLNAFVDDLDRRAAEQHAPVAEGVTLATFHAAKGLEWDSVFLVGLQDGTLPITYAQTPAAIEEERRLLYVGMTRARVDLAVSWAAARNPGQAARRKPSRFLDPLLPDSARPVARGKARAKGARTCVECGKPLSTAERTRSRCSDCPVPYDEALFERLREWRKQRAAEEEIAAFMVFSNATLEAVAERRPTTPKALLAISGVGPEKLEKYGQELLELVS
ncbi:ATP-dependent DNA helicase UvrD2 [Nocardioides dongxiaopingii]|uniref:ATP-dependent DNA helicase UvrD2 n=1 Tax=Nocardioides sp. S-1144 TaxID=2582905 RepID=UPI00110EEFCF|nr:ATP-dependent DNA helicase UvrD2 [Nocardioides sp. S-1144]QCW50322.1 ATP-dependent DNA helicase UvrD2 [Nocardioides sp. S-1144]